MALLSRAALSRLPVLLALLALLVGGAALIERSDRQARDTIRKHHLEDLERSLYFAQTIHGTYPPYEAATWCGRLNDPAHAAVRAQVEAALRAQNEKYANAAKPFPTDPLWGQSSSVDLAQEDQIPDYFYWKRSPALFELYAVLEAAPTGERATQACGSAPAGRYDYGISSAERIDRTSFAL